MVIWIRSTLLALLILIQHSAHSVLQDTSRLNPPQANESRRISHWEFYNVTYTPPWIDHLLRPEPLPHIAVFIHAAINTFEHKRRGEKNVVDGLDILVEMLHIVVNSPLKSRVDGIYITALGSSERRSELRTILKKRFHMTNRIQIIVESSNTDLV